jgi:hypothetical protein
MDANERSRSCRNKQVSEPIRDPLDIICPFSGCNKSFAYQRSLNRHVSNVHGISPVPHLSKSRAERLRLHAQAQDRYWKRKTRRNRTTERYTTDQEEKNKTAMKIQNKLQYESEQMQIKNKLAFDKMYQSLIRVSDSDTDGSSSE